MNRMIVDKTIVLYLSTSFLVGLIGSSLPVLLRVRHWHWKNYYTAVWWSWNQQWRPAWLIKYSESVLQGSGSW